MKMITFLVLSLDLEIVFVLIHFLIMLFLYMLAITIILFILRNTFIVIYFLSIPAEKCSQKLKVDTYIL